VLHQPPHEAPPPPTATSRHKRSKVDLRYGFFYDSYDTRFYYWESIVLVEKLLMVLAITLLQRKNATVQVLVALIIISLATIAQISLRPSGCNMLHTLTRASLYVLQCTLFLLMVSNLEEIATNQVVVAALALAAVLNGILVLTFFYAFSCELRRMLLLSVGKDADGPLSWADVRRSVRSLLCSSCGGGGAGGGGQGAAATVTRKQRGRKPQQQPNFAAAITGNMQQQQPQLQPMEGGGAAARAGARVDGPPVERVDGPYGWRGAEQV